MTAVPPTTTTSPTCTAIPTKPVVIFHSIAINNSSSNTIKKPHCCKCKNQTATQTVVSGVELPAVPNLSNAYVQIQSFPPYPWNQINMPNISSSLQKPVKWKFPLKTPMKFSPSLHKIPVNIPLKVSSLIGYNTFLKPLYVKLAKFGLIKSAAIPIAIAMGLKGLKKKATPVSNNFELDIITPPKYVYPPIPIVYSRPYYAPPKTRLIGEHYRNKPTSTPKKLHN